MRTDSSAADPSVANKSAVTNRSVWVRWRSHSFGVSLLSLIKQTGIFCLVVLGIVLALNSVGSPARGPITEDSQKQLQNQPQTAVTQLAASQLAASQLADSQLETSRSAPPESEIRGVWLTNVASSVLFSPWGIARAVEQLESMQFNTLYPVVWNRGQTFYHSDRISKITQRDISPMIGLMHPTEDPLAEMVRRGHQHNLRVIPWFEYGFMVPLQSRLAKAHPDWLTTRQNGSLRLKEDAFAVEPIGETPQPEGKGQSAKAKGINRLLKSGAPTELGWLNPLHPGVQSLILDLVIEVVSNYDVDGIQFDDHFSLPVEFGYDAFTVALYEKEHDGRLPPLNPADEDWRRWRAGKLSNFAKILHEQVKAQCPDCVFSLSPNPASYAYEYYLQDWRTWVENDWLDELVVQVYRDDLDQFAAELAKNTLQSARDRIPVSIGILTGTWGRPIAFEQIKQQVISSRDHHFSGVSFFYWDTLWSYFTPEPPQQRRQNFRELLQEVG